MNNINVPQGFEIDDIQQFVSLWEMVSEVNLHNDVPDTIAWKFTSDGAYSAKSAYKMQFEGIVSTSLDATVWQAWAPPKCNFFAWLVLQNRIWTADRLQRRGWQICGNCPLCNQVQESTGHLLYKYRYTIRIWKEILT